MVLNSPVRNQNFSRCTVNVNSAPAGFPQGNSQSSPFNCSGILKFMRIRTLGMRIAAQSMSTKRPTCPSCSKPARICLCNRLATPSLDNSVAVSILQHSLEKKHPLNSSRIAKIGLKNVDVVTVSDVNFQARFFIRSPGSRCGVDHGSHLFDEMPDGSEHPKLAEKTNLGDLVSNEQIIGLSDSGKSGGSESIAFDFTVGKYGALSSSIRCHIGIAPDYSLEMSLDQLLASDLAVDVLRKGFVVQKLGTKLLEGSKEYGEIQEFEVTVPPGSVLLFPSERSVDVQTLDFEVKNLIVLDGTWAKAKRMYNENPWFKLLPHMRLNLDKLSLYSEVRHQPRAGYLSTIESIVHAMKAMGEDPCGLDGLLDVFESMVRDQRQFKNERLSKSSKK